jgi:hypothetical protein
MEFLPFSRLDHIPPDRLRYPQLEALQPPRR